MTSLDSVLSYLRSSELAYIFLIFIIFIVPKFLQRFRLPAAITSFGLGMVAGLGLGYFGEDATIALLSTLGIVTLFLHAGLDINMSELHRHRRILLQHVALFVVGLLSLVLVLDLITDYSMRVCILVALALVTPSTGFILDSLRGQNLSAGERDWIKSKAIAAELVALVCMFFTLQSLTWTTLLVSCAVMVVLVLVIPLLFRLFARSIAPFAPNSEFAFLIMLAMACAFITRKVGAYYLVGAFVVGLAARRYQDQIPSVSSERLIGSLELFASFFVPFYFFHSGLQLTSDNFSSQAWLWAAISVGAVIPARIFMVTAHRKWALGEPMRVAARVATPMVPTLVFTLVLAQLLREQFTVPSALYGGLVLYAMASSLLTSFVFKSQEPDYSAAVYDEGLSRMDPHIR